MFVYLSWNPFEEPHRKKIEYFNEIVLMLVLYSLVCYSKFVLDVEVKFQMGYVIVVIIYSHILISFIIIGV